MSKIKTMKRTLVFCIVLSIMTNTGLIANASTAESNQTTDSSLVNAENTVLISYDMATKEVTYGVESTKTTQIMDESTLIPEENTVSPTSIVNGETRKKVDNVLDSPYRNVCYVSVTFPDGSTAYGSGVLVGPNVMLTAAHVVHKSESGGFATDVSIFPARTTQHFFPLGGSKSERISVTNHWVDDTDYNWDWAVVDLSDSYDTWELCALYANDTMPIGREVTAIGYPEDKGCYFMYEDTNTIKEVTEYCIRGYFDATQGESGGPLFDTKTGYVVGVISRGWTEGNSPNGPYNDATRITQFLYDLIKSHISS